MKKVVLLLLVFLFIPLSHGSKLSKFFNKMEAKEQARQQQELQQDMNFNDFAFRLDKRYENQGQHCRDYVFRSRSNPYRQGYFTVCDG